MDYRTGAIYYDKINNVYYIVTDYDAIHYNVRCLCFEGFETDHKYIDAYKFHVDYLNDESQFNQVGGIY